MGFLEFARPLNSSKDGNAAACNGIQENFVLAVFWQQFGEILFLLHMTMPHLQIDVRKEIIN